MRAHNKLFRFAAWIATFGMILGPAAPAVQAQTAPPPPPADQAQGPEVTPPLRVGRMAWMQGAVSFHTADQSDWSPAVVNYPVTTGDGFWTQPGAEAGIQVSDVLVALNATTELDVSNLDETSFVATEPQGEIYLHVGTLTPGETYAIQTPRGTVTIATSGRYEIAAGTTQSPTLVTVLQGTAQITGAPTLDVPAGGTAEITGDQVFQAQIVPAVHDAFLNAMLAREQRRPAIAAAPPLVAQMPGGAELAEYGSWSQAPQYGQVWYPQVAAGWAPYREGHWAYVAPWGWTWVDDDPWGFAPFHYGRWVEIGGRWAWVPGTEIAAAAPPQPVYAPALVAFFGIGAALAAGAVIGGTVGWCPLGPGEAWHPWFHASPAYFRDVNIRHVANINTVNITNVNNVTINQFRNARAATMVPASAMLTSAQVRPLARGVPAAQLAQARPVFGRVPIRPTTATLGVSPATARQLHIGAPPAGIAASARPAAPGPAIRQPTAFVAGQRPAAPALRTPEEAMHASARPGEAPRAAGAIPQAPSTMHEMPALRAPAPPGRLPSRMNRAAPP